MKKRISNVKKLKGHAQGRYKCEKVSQFVAHNFRIEIMLKFCQFCCFQDRATKKQQQQEKAKNKFARNQQIVGSFRAR